MVVGDNMENIEENRKKLINKRSEIKEQFLREEISADEYNRLKNEEIKILPGVIIHLSKNIVHSLKADENTSFLLALQ